jgi:hypothetical protein
VLRVVTFQASKEIWNVICTFIWSWAMKPDAPPLLDAGVHHLTSHRLKQIAVDAFPGDARRAELFGKFLAWREQLRAAGITGTAWLDGSFLTEKYKPDDIDLILWFPTISRPLTSAEEQLVSALLHKPTCRATYDLDVYCESPQGDDVVHRHAYWKGMFGFCHDGRTAKGIAEVVI